MSNLVSFMHMQLSSLEKMKVGDIQELLNNPDINKAKCRNLLRLLPNLKSETPLSVIVKDYGDRVMKGEPLHKDIHALLTEFLEAVDSYQGNSDTLLELKPQAHELLEARYFSKSYTQN